MATQPGDKKEEQKGVGGQELHIYFGSQTGNAAEFAKLLGEEASSHGIKANVVDLRGFDPATLAKQRLVVFVVSTYGKGGPTDNAKQFYAWLTGDKDLKPDFLAQTKFAVFGCGDKSYRWFNKMAKTTTEKIALRGAQEYPASQA